MDSFKQSARSFDAFPKVSSTYTVLSKSGGVMTLVAVVLCLMIVLHGVITYSMGDVEQSFWIDTPYGDLGQSVQMNVDIIVAMPCDNLEILVADATNDRLVAREVLKMEPANFDLDTLPRKRRSGREALGYKRNDAYLKTKPPSDPMHPSCRIYGTLETPKVTGALYINYRVPQGQFFYQPDYSLLNFSHVITELSFGEFFSDALDPLDGSAVIVAADPQSTDPNMHQSHYFISLVPTKYSHFYSDIHTYQYAVRYYHSVSKASVFRQAHVSKDLPGIMLQYNFEGIGISFEHYRIPFYRFVVHTISIMGGILMLLSLISNAMHSRSARQNPGARLLDAGKPSEGH
ncbi:hypothetical protein CANCADRAFT_22899 [Tortispora caseinolytica NRRL Y-17796]|uniref:Endoplasmic reticulum-Golgi intermediate compartment protein n=1 Tax=Tortispora caseinolytica NRRL Y-17796 TaxID=767744 RepID=A0A1E4TLH1_9ASCO|nr:hypothetical protein CANCADRAFT_22899 [Tortispora caseinolytica NRRL Y-17796]